MSEEHGLPIWTETRDENSYIKPTHTAFNGSLRFYDLPVNEEEIDLLELLIRRKEEIESIIDLNVSQGPHKVQFVAEVVLKKPIADSEEDERIRIFANSSMTPVFADGLSDDQFFTMTEQMILVIHNFASHGSGWILETIDRLTIKAVRFSPIRPGSHLRTPTELKEAPLINIQSKDGRCFQHCYTAAYHLQFGPTLVSEKSHWRQKFLQTTYDETNPLANLPKGEFDAPMPLNQIGRFEHLNKVQVNVFRLVETFFLLRIDNALTFIRYHQSQLLPYRISKATEYKFVIDLLILSDGLVHHYVLITDLPRLIAKVRGKQFRKRNELCRNCFHTCSSVKTLESHQALCLANEPVLINMPTEKNMKVLFKSHSARWFAPVVVYYDMESIIRPVLGCEQKDSVSSTEKMEVHEPCSLGMVIVEHGTAKVPEYLSFRNEKPAECFLDRLENLAREVYEKKRRFPEFVGVVPNEIPNVCWICEEPFELNEISVIDHCHYTGNFLGKAHQKCNVNRRTINFIPVLAHNAMGYDIHYVLKALKDRNPKNTISVIPSTDEKFIALSYGVWIKDYIDKKGNPQSVYENLRFLDSYKFMTSSLQTLCENLPKEKFKILSSCFPDAGENISFLQTKGFYPYSYVNSFEKFQERSLPPLEEWCDSLHGKEPSINEQQLAFAQKVFNEFGCTTLGDYHDLYLKTMLPSLQIFLRSLDIKLPSSRCDEKWPA